MLGWRLETPASAIFQLFSKTMHFKHMLGLNFCLKSIFNNQVCWTFESPPLHDCYCPPPLLRFWDQP